MKNITVSVDDATYHQARIVAAERGTSVSALVRQFLDNLAKRGDEHERLKQAERVLRQGITGFNGGDRLPRDEIHRR